LRTRLKSFADSRGTSSVAEGAGLGRLKGKQQHKVPLSDAAVVALGEVASNKTHYAWEAIEAALAHSIGNKVEIRPITSSRSGSR
jgi:hypothetical protein